MEDSDRWRREGRCFQDMGHVIIADNLVNTYYTPTILLNPVRGLTHLILTVTL